MSEQSSRRIEQCSRCESPADLRFGGEWLCPDCYEDEPMVGGHVGTRKKTAQASRERLQKEVGC